MVNGLLEAPITLYLKSAITVLPFTWTFELAFITPTWLLAQHSYFPELIAYKFLSSKTDVGKPVAPLV